MADPKPAVSAETLCKKHGGSGSTLVCPACSLSHLHAMWNVLINELKPRGEHGISAKALLDVIEERERAARQAGFEEARKGEWLRVVRHCTDCGGPMVEVPPETPGGEYLAVACVHHIYRRMQNAERQLDQERRMHRALTPEP